jgi:hypothetical protein
MASGRVAPTLRRFAREAASLTLAAVALLAALRLLEPLLDADYDAARRSGLPDGAG